MSEDAVQPGEELHSYACTAHNFFEPQPAENTNIAVYLLRMIMHNWPDAECVQILKRVRAACTPNTRIVIVDNIMLYASRDQTVEGADVGAQDPDALAPEPLLANWGAANSLSYKQDINVRACDPFQVAPYRLSPIIFRC